MFVSRVGPRTPEAGSARRCIRLSVPLLQHPSRATEQELLGTLAHEMIHQWQFDILKRRPNHGPDFRRKMVEMNRKGLGVTISHALDEAVLALAKYAWRCLGCGKVYQRQRRTIRPSRHRCGCCRGALRLLSIDQ
jgi:predicted SprT family Zn-dependent metalloprotease